MASIEYYSDLNLGGNEIKNTVVDKVSTIPTGTGVIAGRIIYLTTAAEHYPVGFYYCDGTNWKQIATGGDTTAITTQVGYLKTLVGMNDSGEATKADGTVTKDVDDLKTLVGAKTDAAAADGSAFAQIKTKQDTITAGTGLAFGTGAAAATLGHSNSVTAATTAVGGASAALKVKYDAQGHITETSTDAMYPPTTVGTNGQYWGTDGTTPAWKSPATSLTALSTTEIPSSKAVADAISAALTTAYKVKGSALVSTINGLSNMAVGDVYDITDSGTITNTGKTSFTVVPGDNIVWTGNGEKDKGWDLLAHTYDIDYPVTDVTVGGSSIMSGTTIATLGAAAGKGVDTSSLTTANDNTVPSSKLVSTELGGKMAKLSPAPATGGALLVTVASDDDAIAVQSAAVGGTAKPIYINASGVPTAISGTIGAADTPVYIASDGTITAGTQIGTAGYLAKTVQGSGTDSVFTPSSTNDNVPTDKAVYTALTKKVDANSAITAGTNCKITYDAKGLVTAGAGLTADDIPTLTASKISDFADSAEAKVTAHFKEIALNAYTGVSAVGNTYTITTTSQPYGVMVLHSGKQAFVDTTIGATSIVLAFNSAITPADFKVTYILKSA